jgi:predicted nucleotidyltransferase
MVESTMLIYIFARAYNAVRILEVRFVEANHMHTNYLKKLTGDYVLSELRRRLSDLPSYVKAVLLFGSIARGEADERSDVDVLLLHGDAPFSDLVEHRRHFYGLVAEGLGGAFESITMIDMELEHFLKPKTATPPTEHLC